MTLLVDDAVWPWRDRRWAHLVSDESYGELHEAAQRIGVRRLGFQGDHYDIDETDRERAVIDGAVAVDSRELLRRLRGAGLRRSGAKPEWARLADWPAGSEVDAAVLEPHGDAGRRILTALESFGHLLSDLGVLVFGDERRLVALLEFGSPMASSIPAIGSEVTAVVDEVIVGGPRADGDRSIELFVTK